MAVDQAPAIKSLDANAPVPIVAAAPEDATAAGMTSSSRPNAITYSVPAPLSDDYKNMIAKKEKQEPGFKDNMQQVIAGKLMGIQMGPRVNTAIGIGRVILSLDPKDYHAEAAVVATETGIFALDNGSNQDLGTRLVWRNANPVTDESELGYQLMQSLTDQAQAKLNVPENAPGVRYESDMETARALVESPTAHFKQISQYEQKVTLGPVTYKPAPVPVATEPAAQTVEKTEDQFADMPPLDQVIPADLPEKKRFAIFGLGGNAFNPAHWGAATWRTLVEGHKVRVERTSQDITRSQRMAQREAAAQKAAQIAAAQSAPPVDEIAALLEKVAAAPVPVTEANGAINAPAPQMLADLANANKAIAKYNRAMTGGASARSALQGGIGAELSQPRLHASKKAKAQPLPLSLDAPAPASVHASLRAAPSQEELRLQALADGKRFTPAAVIPSPSKDGLAAAPIIAKSTTVNYAQRVTDGGTGVKPVMQFLVNHKWTSWVILTVGIVTLGGLAARKPGNNQTPQGPGYGHLITWLRKQRQSRRAPVKISTAPDGLQNSPAPEMGGPGGAMHGSEQARRILANSAVVVHDGDAHLIAHKKKIGAVLAKPKQWLKSLDHAMHQQLGALERKIDRHNEHEAALNSGFDWDFLQRHLAWRDAQDVDWNKPLIETKKRSPIRIPFALIDRKSEERLAASRVEALRPKPQKPFSDAQPAPL